MPPSEGKVIQGAINKFCTFHSEFDAHWHKPKGLECFLQGKGVLFGLLLKTTTFMHKRNLCHSHADKVNQGK